MIRESYQKLYGTFESISRATYMDNEMRKEITSDFIILKGLVDKNDPKKPILDEVWKCPNCLTVVTDNYCPHCGQRVWGME